MPYISKIWKDEIDGGRVPVSAGELNYVITKVIKNYLGKDFNYRLLNETVGVLECCKLELYRRMVAPYEDIKCQENGDVYK